jgi:hypothetical protein
MPNLFRTCDGIERKPSAPIPLLLADGSVTEGVWAGSATDEKLGDWLRNKGTQIAQSEPVAAVASKADDNDEMIWGDAPNGARLIFVLQASPPGKNYRLAKMVTVAATSSQAAYFRHHRSALFGTLQPDGSIKRIPPVNPPPPLSPEQGELF